MSVFFTKIKATLRSTNFLSAAILVALLAFYILFLAHPIFLTPADIGRHIKNGELLLADSANWWSLLHTNFYSSINASAPFINHHWASGIVFFLIWKIGGFTAISLFGLLISAATLGLCFDVARRKGGFMLAATLTFFLIPLIAERAEVRPEQFSYFFCALYFWLFTAYRDGRLSWWWLCLVPFLQILWVNLHIYFFLGFAVTGAFWLEEYFKSPRDSKRFRFLTLIGLSLVIASFINPSAWRGALYPFQIFNNYGLAVSENQPVRAFFAAHKAYVNLYIFEVVFYALAIAALLAIIKNRRLIKGAEFILMFFLSFMAWQMVKNITLFALFALPATAIYLKTIYDKSGWATSSARTKKILAIAGVLAVIIFTVIINWSKFPTLLKTRGIGLLQGTENAANFIKKNNLQGPIFNDFDSGSYIIFYSYPRLRPFVDNRPEACASGFFENIYFPMHTDNAIWETKSKEYGFNAILYSFDNKADYAMTFIVNRLLDPDWAPVYADKFSIIFLKRDELNTALIKQYEISKDHFSLSPT